jgi:hypothetical protein
MAVLRPRNRLVYFRVSEDEFQQFNQICETERARSVSDLARYAVQRMINDGTGKSHPEEVAAKLQVLEAGISDLSKRVQELTAFVKGKGAGGVREAEGRPIGDTEE